ncbi:MAG: ribosomal protein S18-alanine N-acetyltransferase [Bacteroidales bacterium]|nr:ribosomal protein S18-alanine N-acetyltransferase [Bacteroidales bacterium]
MSDKILIEKAEFSDLKEIVDIENASFTTDKFSSRQFAYLLRKSKAKFFKAVSGEKILGYIILLKPKNAKKLRLYSIAVHPNARGKGLAQMLMDKTLETAKKLNCQGIKLEVRPNNLSAISLYKKNGYCEKGKIESYYSDGSEALIMELKLKVR